MATDRRSPAEVFEAEPAAARGFDEQQLRNTIEEFALKHGALAAIQQLTAVRAEIATNPQKFPPWPKEVCV